MRNFSRNFNKFLFVLPALVFFIGVTIYPLINSFIMSFYKYRLSQLYNVKFIGLDNYIKVLTDSVFLSSLARTLFLTIILVSIELLLGIFFAVILSQSFKGHGIVRSLLVLPIAATPVVVGLTWKMMFDYRIGVINYLLSFININGPLWLANDKWALVGVIMMDVWQWTPFMVIILLAGILGQSREIFEAALVDGANRLQTTFKITIPLLKGVMWVAILIRSMDVFRLFDQVWMLTNGGPGTSTETLTVHIYKEGFSFLNMGKASAMSFIMLFTLMIFVIITMKNINIISKD